MNPRFRAMLVLPSRRERLESSTGPCYHDRIMKPTRQHLIAALTTIAQYPLFVYTVPIDGKDEAMVPLASAEALRQVAKDVLGIRADVVS